MDNLSYSPDLQHFLDLYRCADTNDTNAMLRLAKVYLNVNGENTNKKALCLLKQLANAPYTAAQTDAQYMLASCYETGKGITKNYKQAAKWIGKPLSMQTTIFILPMKIIQCTVKQTR